MKVLISKPGLDGHDRGAKVIARAFQDAGAEVIYTGLQTTPEEIADIVEKEKIDVVGISLLSGAHNTLVPKVIDKVKEHGINDVVYILGGIIPQQDIPGLKEKGVAGVFGPGTRLDETVDFAFEQVAAMHAGKMIEDMGDSMAAKSSNI
ncbi:MAG: cobalamin B12-binding domain-containing protein [Synergistaceae bacterium]|nr:cobalamin B12-binding domain-containing protein [Synergistaceae bacterium]MBR1418592.1 cobalamin B12-binding domain-containing protein [Synergistaceae bacterium]MBR1604281.1 cobalamin B12-binding domain-containing protein [Synergistaceae bacterium]